MQGIPRHLPQKTAPRSGISRTGRRCIQRRLERLPRSALVFYDVDIQVVVGHLHAVLPEGVPQVLPQSQIRAPPVLRRSPAVDCVLDRALLVCGEVDGGSRGPPAGFPSAPERAGRRPSPSPWGRRRRRSPAAPPAAAPIRCSWSSGRRPAPCWGASPNAHPGSPAWCGSD